MCLSALAPIAFIAVVGSFADQRDDPPAEFFNLDGSGFAIASLLVRVSGLMRAEYRRYIHFG
jgi:hypothetical protein